MSISIYANCGRVGTPSHAKLFKFIISLTYIYIYIYIYIYNSEKFNLIIIIINSLIFPSNLRGLTTCFITSFLNQLSNLSK